MACFVLVHGSFHGGWCWRDVSPSLRAAGHDVYAPTLTGLGERSHLLAAGVDLRTHITDVSNVLFYEDLRDVILVGHSYAGLVITGVAATDPERIAQLIYLDAYVPKAGQSWFDMRPPNEGNADRQAMIEAKGFRESPPPEFFGVAEPTQSAWMQARLKAQAIGTYDQPVPDGAPGTDRLRRAYIHCTLGPLASRFAPFAAEARANGWRVRELSSGHDAMLIVPSDLANVLIELSTQTAD